MQPVGACTSCAVLLQTYGNLTTEAGLDEVAAYAAGIGPDKMKYILNVSDGKALSCTPP